MEFMCCLNMVFTWKSSRQAEVYLYDFTRHNIATRNEHFVYAFVDVNVVSGNDAFKLDFASWCHFAQRDSTYEIQIFNDFKSSAGSILN